MKVFAVSDLHLSINNPKPMDIFGGAWDNYLEILTQNWKAKISDDDLVLISGDISWAMTLEEALPDLDFIHALPGKKIIIRGNHDYWWKSISGLRKKLPPSIMAIQNDCVKIENFLICGTRGWTVPESSQIQTDQDRKIYLREAERLKLTLNAASKERVEGDIVILMMHFPPFNSARTQSDYTRLIAQYNVDCVVYGHLHGKGGKISHKVVLDNIPYYLTSCDQLNNDPLQLY
ncbi:MAG TPA: metallophosphoesterase [Clostridia bacterium]